MDVRTNAVLKWANLLIRAGNESTSTQESDAKTNVPGPSPGEKRCETGAGSGKVQLPSKIAGRGR